MLEAQRLRKAYGDRVAVQEVSLAVGAGEVLGLLGPNGAGKSTTVGMLCGLIAPDAGTVAIASQPLRGTESAQRALLLGSRIASTAITALVLLVIIFVAAIAFLACASRAAGSAWPAWLWPLRDDG